MLRQAPVIRDIRNWIPTPPPLSLICPQHTRSRLGLRDNNIYGEKKDIQKVLRCHIISCQDRNVTTSVFCSYAIVDPLYMQGFILGKGDRMQKKRRGKGNEKGIWQGLFCTGGSHVASRWWSLASGTCHRLPPKSISCPTPCALTFYVETGTFHPVFYLLL